jgi:hypothetical protein
MAAFQKAAKLDMRDRHQREQSELKSRSPQRVQNIKKWLELEASDESFISFRYPDNGTLLGHFLDGEQNKPAPPRDIRNFVPSIGNKGGVAYRENGETEAQFIDYGKKIVLGQKCDESAILAALQLANQKWGSAVINGTEEYKRLCVELAIRHNLRIANPELTQKVEAGQKSMSQQKGGEKMRDDTNKKFIFSQYADVVGAERFRIVVTEFKDSGTSAFLFDKKNGGYEGKTRDEILDAIPKLSAYAHYNKNIIVTPMSSDKHHILVDDLTPEKLRQLKDDGYSPACVIESSPKNFQAVLTVPSIEGETGKDRAAANKLTRELNLKYGDPKLSGSVHGHRLPPFPNCKPKHRREDGTYPNTALTESNGGFCEKARKELEFTYSEMKEVENKARKETETRARMTNHFTGSNDPNSAYWAHYRDIKRDAGLFPHRRKDRHPYESDGVLGRSDTKRH